MAEISYRRHRFPPVVIQHAVWLYLRFTLSYRDVEELFAERGAYEPNVDLQLLHFAAGTPYETEMMLKPEPQRVLASEIAKTVRQALMGVAMEGTAKRLAGAYHTADGQPLPVGGKTGTGDNRLDRFGRGGRLISQRVVDRTATFVFFLGDRFFGTITAYVPGSVAGSYHFTSALAVQLLKAIQPQLEPLLNSPVTNASPRAISADAPPASGLKSLPPVMQAPISEWDEAEP